MYLRHLFVIASLGWTSMAIAESGLGSPTPIRFSALNELSGIVKSRRFEDVYWAHNDSGDQPRLFALEGRERLSFPDF